MTLSNFLNAILYLLTVFDFVTCHEYLFYNKKKNKYQKKILKKILNNLRTHLQIWLHCCLTNKIKGMSREHEKNSKQTQYIHEYERARMYVLMYKTLKRSRR